MIVSRVLLRNGPIGLRSQHCTIPLAGKYRQVQIMECSLCATRLPSPASYISHLRLVDAADRSFNIKCGINNCSSHFKSFQVRLGGYIVIIEMLWDLRSPFRTNSYRISAMAVQLTTVTAISMIITRGL